MEDEKTLSLPGFQSIRCVGCSGTTDNTFTRAERKFKWGYYETQLKGRYHCANCAVDVEYIIKKRKYERA